MLKDVRIPEISENVTSGKIVSVLVKPGDLVAVDDTLVEMETEKAVVEIPSPYAGKISEVLVQEGDEKNVGDVIIKIEVEEDEKAEAEEQKQAQPGEAASQEKPEETEKAPEAEKEKEAEALPAAGRGAETKEEKASKEQERPESPAPEEDRESEQKSQPPAPAAPSARRFARELGVDIGDVRGSGPDGRISREDVSAYVKQRLSAKEPAASAAAAQPRLPDFSRWGPVRTERIETVRRLTAESTSVSWRIAPHVTQFDEADVTALQEFIQRHARQAEKKGGKLTLTAVLMKVCAAALVRFPRFNASIDMEEGELIYKDYVHIGMAVDTSRGLLVPVIRDVDAKGILDLAAEIVDTAQRARSKKIKPDEFEGGTFTISNQGGIGGVNFTPVILWPQAAILGISRARRMLVEIDGEFQARTILPLCVSYDHRIIDGADAARFLDWICRGLEQAMTMFL